MNCHNQQAVTGISNVVVCVLSFGCQGRIWLKKKRKRFRNISVFHQHRTFSIC